MILSFIRLVLIAMHSVFCSSMIILCSPVDSKKTLYQYFARLYGRGTLWIAGMDLKIEGTEHLDPSKSYVYVANHASLFDIPTILAGIPDDIRIIYKKELHYVPIFGWGLKLGKAYIAVDRKRGVDAMRSLDKAVGKIIQGASIFLFAEGTRTNDGRLQKFKRGPFNLAVRANVPVVPVTINGTFTMMQKGTFRLRSGTINLIIGEPIEIGEESGKDAEFILRDKAYDVISSHHTEK